MTTINEKQLGELRDRLTRYVSRRLRDVHLVEDIVQDVLLRLHVHAAELPEDPVRLLAWALRVARNRTIDLHRSPRRKTAALDLAAEPADPRADADSAPRSADLAGCARSMVELLPREYRDAVVLADLMQHPQDAVARQLGISRSGAKSRVQRGRRRLRAMIDDCCAIELGRRGSVLAVEPTPRAAHYCGSIPGNENSCVHSAAGSSSR